MKKKLLILLPVLLVAIGGLYKGVLAKPSGPPPKHKVEGEVYVVPKDFFVNLRGGRFAKLSIALVLEPGFSAAGPGAGGGKHAAPAPEPPDGYGTLPQEALVRAIVTDVLSDQPARRMTSSRGRAALGDRILKQLRRRTDVQVAELRFTDVVVQ